MIESLYSILYIDEHIKKVDNCKARTYDDMKEIERNSVQYHLILFEFPSVFV